MGLRKERMELPAGCFLFFFKCNARCMMNKQRMLFGPSDLRDEPGASGHLQRLRLPCPGGLLCSRGSCALSDLLQHVVREEARFGVASHQPPASQALPSAHRSRGFGQLVRARNIKTVGDLSALTATEIKTLPIRSPKISNVKKALKNYDQQVSDWQESTAQIQDRIFRIIGQRD